MTDVIERRTNNNFDKRKKYPSMLPIWIGLFFMLIIMFGAYYFITKEDRNKEDLLEKGRQTGYNEILDKVESWYNNNESEFDLCIGNGDVSKIVCLNKDRSWRYGGLR